MLTIMAVIRVLLRIGSKLMLAMVIASAVVLIFVGANGS